MFIIYAVINLNSLLAIVYYKSDNHSNLNIFSLFCVMLFVSTITKKVYSISATICETLYNLYMFICEELSNMHPT